MQSVKNKKKKEISEVPPGAFDVNYNNPNFCPEYILNLAVQQNLAEIELITYSCT